MSGFEPKPFHIIATPEGLKAFTDPLRLRVLNILRQRAATNQQVADALGEPHAKVLYHVRILLDAGLIQLVDQQIKGGNVEKYYRAIANLFGLRVGDGPAPGVVTAMLEVAQQEAVASEVAWPADLPLSETRRARMSPERRAEFFQRVNELIAEYWGGPVPGGQDGEEVVLTPEEDPAMPRYALAVITYRDPTVPGSGETR
jgi:DNA-binding transcriptional ArsR family regulator